jgi:hypothetical protein
MTKAEWIALIITEIGGDTSTNLLATNLPTYWDLHTSAADDAARALLTKMDGLRLLLGQTWRQVTFRALDGVSVNLSDMFDHLKELLSLAEAQAGAASGAGGGGIAVGSLTTTAPIMSDHSGGIDPNDRRYRGDPLRRP